MDTYDEEFIKFPHIINLFKIFRDKKPSNMYSRRPVYQDNKDDLLFQFIQAFKQLGMNDKWKQTEAVN